jgi:hypothetical protein
MRSLFAEYSGQQGPKRGFGPSHDQYPNYQELEEAIGLNTASHPIYAHLPYAKVANWRVKETPLQARMAFWCAAVMFHVEQEKGS